jgi:hypothetical protein
MDVPVPVGEPVKGIKIPQYDEQGKLTMNLTAETALKLDEKKVEFNNLRIQFADKEEKEIIVEIPHSILDLESRLLVADSRTEIRREDFDIAGDKAEFDTVARTGTFKGPVRASFRPGLPRLLPKRLLRSTCRRRNRCRPTFPRSNSTPSSASRSNCTPSNKVRLSETVG